MVEISMFHISYRSRVILAKPAQQAKATKPKKNAAAENISTGVSGSDKNTEKADTAATPAASAKQTKPDIDPRTNAQETIEYINLAGRMT